MFGFRRQRELAGTFSRTSSPARRAFTLVELLVVIGIIAVLISVLLPTLSSARKQADRVKCMSNMRSLGHAFFMYAHENKGYWPAARHTWDPGTPVAGVGYSSRDKRWHDFIGKYVTAPVIAGTGAYEHKTNEFNFHGTQSSTVELQLWTPVIKEGGKSMLWGCPTWNRAIFSSATGTGTVTLDGIYWNGYSMNPFPFAPNDLNGALINASKRSWPDRMPPIPATGSYFKQNQYSRPAERALVFESVHPWYFNNMRWTYKPEGVVTFPTVPFVSTATTELVIDFMRHSRKGKGTGPNELALNVLFCDGHVENTSCRKAFKAIRFN